METKLHRIAIFGTLFFLLGILSSCRHVEKTLTERTVRVDSIEVEKKIGKWRLIATRAVFDTTVIEDARMRLEITRVGTPTNHPDAENQMRTVPISSESISGTDPPPDLLDWFRIDATIKPDTVKVKVPQKTITEKIETTVIEKEMPNWGWIVIGIMGGFLLVILIGGR